MPTTGAARWHPSSGPLWCCLTISQDQDNKQGPRPGATRLEVGPHESRAGSRVPRHTSSSPALQATCQGGAVHAPRTLRSRESPRPLQKKTNGLAPFFALTCRGFLRIMAGGTTDSPSSLMRFACALKGGLLSIATRELLLALQPSPPGLDHGIATWHTSDG